MLISRDYRGDLPASVIDKFLPLVLEQEDDSSARPIVQCDEVWWRKKIETAQLCCV